MHDWFHELVLDPGAGWLRMGTRSLGDRPWLIRDHRADEELAQKAELLAARRDEVLATGPGSEAAGQDVLDLVVGATGSRPTGAGHPLEQAARLVQEDLCLLQRRDGAWHLDAACVCFPSRWRPADKFQRPLGAVHGPVDGYDGELAGRVDRLLDRLTDRPVLRRNWFVHPDGALFQPSAPPVDPVVPAARALAELHLRSERQTLRRLPSGWVLFTIRTQHALLGEALASADRRRRFAEHLRLASPHDLHHRGMSPPQVSELLATLAR